MDEAVNGWVTVVAHCEECGHTWATSLPVSWDGSPIACIFCGEIGSVEVGE